MTSTLHGCRTDDLVISLEFTGVGEGNVAEHGEEYINYLAQTCHYRSIPFTIAFVFVVVLFTNKHLTTGDDTVDLRLKGFVTI